MRKHGWDWLVRLTHWSVAVLFALNYFFISPDLYSDTFDVYTHVYIGYGVAILVLLRILWGVTFAKGPNRMLSFIPTPARFKHHLVELKTRQAEDQPQHNPIGAIGIWFMWIMLLGIVSSGWLYDNTDWGWDNDLHKLHQQLGDILFYVVILHISAVILTSLWLRRNLIKAMIIGRF